jgi:hypothetical protein
MIPAVFGCTACRVTRLATTEAASGERAPKSLLTGP